MDSRALLYLERSHNELELANAVYKLSTNEQAKLLLEVTAESTFYSNVISTAYFAIFYAAKALLSQHGIMTDAPNEHAKTLEAFEQLAAKGGIDAELIRIYRQLIIRAETLLGIFRYERRKRGTFTYKRLPQSNQDPAAESLANAEKFCKNITLLLKG
jgi:uncharacterized protein (UPF0332 family)